MPKKERDLRQKNDPNQKEISVDEMNMRLDRILENSSDPANSKKDQKPVKVGSRLQDIKKESLSVMQQLQAALDQGDEKQINALTQKSDKMTAEYCALLGFAMEPTGKLNNNKLNIVLTPDVIEKQTARAEQNPVFQWMKAGTSATQAMKNMHNVGNVPGEVFAQETMKSFANHYKYEKTVDGKVDDILREMGFNPAKLRAESAAVRAKPMVLPRAPESDGPEPQARL